MSAISTILTRLRAAIWAIDVRDDIANAIEQCYSDVSNPTLQTEALEAALQEKIDQGEMAALTIGDGTITGAKLASGVIDNTLATSGAAADAKKTGDEIAAVKADLDALEPGLSAEAKAALLTCFEKLVWKDGNGQSYYNALAAALTPYPKIEVVYNPGTNIVYESTGLNSIKQYLTVKYYDSPSSQGQTVSANDYTLSGALTVGKSIISASYNNCVTAFIVPVHKIMIDGYSSSNSAAVATAGAYVLKYNSVYTYDNTNPVSKIKLNVSTPGQLTLCTIAASSIQDNKVIDVWATLEAKDTVTISDSGEQIVDLVNPFVIPDGYYLVIGANNLLPGIQDTCKWKYGQYGSQKGFGYNGGASNNSLGVNVYVGG